MPDRKGVVDDQIDTKMRFYYPPTDKHSKCFLGPEFDYQDPDGCYACILEVRPDCRSSWMPGSKPGQTPVHKKPKPMQGGMFCLLKGRFKVISKFKMNSR